MASAPASPPLSSSASNPSPSPSPPPPSSRSSNVPSPPTPSPNDPTVPPPHPSNSPPPPSASTTVFVTSFSTSLSTSGTSTFSVVVPIVTPTVTATKSGNSSESSSFFTPAFWGISGAILGAICLCAGAICFLRGRVRNKRNDRVYRPGAPNSSTFPPNRPFHSGPTSPMRSNLANQATGGKNPNSAGYAGTVTLVEIADSSPPLPISPPVPPQGYIATPPPTTQPSSYLMAAPIPAYSPIPPNTTVDPYGNPYVPPVTGPFVPPGPDYGMMHAPNINGGGPLPGAEMMDNGDGVITFAPTVNRSDDEYMNNNLPPPPAGMAYRINEHSMQPELYYMSDQSDMGPNLTNDSSDLPRRSASPSNAPGVTRRLALPLHP